MPISADRFEDLDEEDTWPRPGTNAHEVLAFLRANADEAYTRGEIAAATGVADGSVGPTLVRLRERGRVDHRGTYWRVSDHVESLGAATSHAAAAAASRESESFASEEWQAHAVDPREQRE
jgi:DNA-binding IclR family transcriptional regulator